jgi:hypothetical protein
MSSYVCPHNNRPCRCDPKAADKNIHPCALTKRASKLVRLMGSTFEGEAITAANKLRQLVQSEGLSFNDLGVLIENYDGKIKKFDDADAMEIFQRGKDKGRSEEAQKRPQAEPTEFYDANNDPRYHEMAMYCRQNLQRLDAKHHDFIDKMAASTLYREPTGPQGRYLLSLFIQLGSGRRR